MGELVLIVGIAVGCYVLYRILKPYAVKYDTTLLFTGGLGSGKSLSSVKTGLHLYKRNTLKWRFKCLSRRIKNFAYKILKKPEKMVPMPVKPLLFSNVPICISDSKKKGKVYSCPLTKEILTLQERIPENSIVLIDELPLLVNQFNWNLKEVKSNLNEFIALFRHYVGGYLIVNGQAESEIVKQIRAKLNSGYWCFHFQKFWIFYRYKIIHYMVSENQTSSSTEFLDDSVKYTYGILPLRKVYDSRYMSERYLRVKKVYEPKYFNKLKRSDLLSFNQDKSCLDEDYQDE